MKKVLSIIAILCITSCSNQSNLNISQIQQPQEITNISSNSEKVSYYSKHLIETKVNKNPAIKLLTGDKIKISKTPSLEPTNNLYVINFSKGAFVDGVVGQLVMYLDKSGESELAMTGNYCKNIPTKLSFQETKDLLKQSSNYKSNLDKLAKLFGN